MLLVNIRMEATFIKEGMAISWVAEVRMKITTECKLYCRCIQIQNSNKFFSKPFLCLFIFNVVFFRLGL